MKFNTKYQRYVTKDGLVFRIYKDKLIPCKLCYNRFGYLQVSGNHLTVGVHRLVYETYKGEVPKGFDVDHINDVKDDNRLDNLRILSHRDNSLKLSTVISTFNGMKNKGYNVNLSNFLRNVTCD